MHTIIYTNTNFKRKKKKQIIDFIIGIIFIVIAFSGLFLGSKFILKLLTYIIPLLLILNAIHTFRLAYSLRKIDFKHFIIFLIQGIISLLAAGYILLFPLESLNYIIIFLGIMLLFNSLSNLMITRSKALSFFPFFIGIICILFSNAIINSFYTLFLIILLFIGISKVMDFIYKLK